MRDDSFRFRPPEIELPPALRWTLARAYGRGEGSSEALVLEADERPPALEWSRALALGERIASRIRDEQIEAEAGVEVAAKLLRARDGLAARSLLLERLLDETAARAADLDCPLVALKGIALLESGAATWGGRPLLDLDLLVDPARAEELASCLVESGLRLSGKDERHHLAPLADERLGELELHVALPGLTLGGSSPTPELLRRADLTQPSPRVRGLFLPRLPLLAAHLIAHGLGQHGLSPTAYPITRLVADILDLAAATRHTVAEVVHSAAPLLDRSVSSRERTAVAVLCEQLAAHHGPGEAPDQGPDSLEGDARALLGHTIAAMTRPRYRRSLRRRAALKALGRGDWRKLRRSRRRKLG